MALFRLTELRKRRKRRKKSPDNRRKGINGPILCANQYFRNNLAGEESCLNNTGNHLQFNIEGGDIVYQRKPTVDNEIPIISNKGLFGIPSKRYSCAQAGQVACGEAKSKRRDFNRDRP